MAYERGTLQRFDFSDEYALNVGTLQLMARLVRERHADPRIRGRARAILADAGVASMDYDGMIRAVFDFVRDHVRYVRDPLGGEYVTDPIELDHQVDDGDAAEDCESLALYAATLLAAIGIKSEFETQAKDMRRPALATHCALQVQHPQTGQWISFDVVGAAAFPGQFDLGDSLAGPGEHVERWTLDGEQKESAMRRMHMAGLISASDFGDGDGMGDAVSTIKDVSVSTATGAAEGSALGPAGAIIGGLLSLGGSIVQAVTGKSVGQLLPGGPIPVGGPGQPLATVGVEHKLDLPTVDKSTKKWLIGGAIVVGALTFGPRIADMFRGRR